MAHPNFAVKSTGRNLKMRDGKTRQMRTLDPRRWTFFDDLPKGAACVDGPDTRIRAVESAEEYAALVAENEHQDAVMGLEQAADGPTEREKFVAEYGQTEKSELVAQAKELGLEVDGRLSKGKILEALFDALNSNAG